VLTLADYFLPGFKAGGPIRSLANLIEQLGDEFRFRVITRDRDWGDAVPYPGISANRWHTVGKAEVLYLSPPRLLPSVLRTEMAKSFCTILYLNSFFSPFFTIQTLILRKLRLIGDVPVIVAPRGEFAPKALEGKSAKKRAYISVSKRLDLYRDVIWQASSTHEAENIRECFGDDVQVAVVPNLVSVAADRPSSARPPKHPGHLRVASIARIARHKNLAFALRALERISSQIEFNIYGPIEDPQYWEECKALMSRLPRNVRAEYRGPLPHNHVLDALTKHHLFFLPTRSESFGHVIAEALLSGCPVLISNQTPWQNLEQNQAGWDLPLHREDLFQRALSVAVDMDQARFDQWSSGARRVGGAELNPDAIERNRALLWMASGSSALVEQANRAVG
jgi:glycosyltransferase involved in cell wall biosynthesis